MTLHCNLAQFLATVIFGIICLAYLGFEKAGSDSVAIGLLVGVILLAGILLYFRPVFGLKLLPGFVKTPDTVSAVQNVDDADLEVKIGALFISILRYGVFLLQYYLLLDAFYVPELEFSIVPALAVVFLITTLIPSFLFGKVFVREAAGLFVLSQFGIPSVIILLTAFLLWFINLAVPSLFGAWVLIRKS